MVSARETSSRRHHDLSGGRSGTDAHAGVDLRRAGTNQLAHSTQHNEGVLMVAALDQKVAEIAGGEVYYGGRKSDDGATAN